MALGFAAQLALIRLTLTSESNYMGERALSQELNREKYTAVIRGTYSSFGPVKFTTVIGCTDLSIESALQGPDGESDGAFSGAAHRLEGDPSFARNDIFARRSLLRIAASLKR